MITYIQNKIIDFLSGSAKEQTKITDIKTSDSGMLTREDTFKTFFDQWKQSKACSDLLNELNRNFLNGEPQGTSKLAIDRHRSPGANGVSIYNLNPDQNPDVDEFRLLMDLFRDKVITLNYRPYSSTFEERILLDKTSRKERHYLKPGAWNTEMPMEQLYGNILIELDLVNDEVEQLKLLATYYTGYDYKPPANFEELVTKLLK